MTVTPIRSVNKDLPHANIYLNDLWEIEDIFVKAFANAGIEVPVTFEYDIDDQKITTREELVAQEGHTTKFILRLIESGRIVRSYNLLSLSGPGNPQLNIPSQLGELAWGIQGRIHAIFSARKNKFKSFIVGLPLWLFLVVSWVLCLGLPVELSRTSLLSKSPVASLLSTLFLAAGCLAAYWRGLSSESRLDLQSSRTDQRARTARFKERVEKLVLLVLGACLGFLGTLLTNHYKH